MSDINIITIMLMVLFCAIVAIIRIEVHYLRTTSFAQYKAILEVIRALSGSSK